MNRIIGSVRATAVLGCLILMVGCNQFPSTDPEVIPPVDPSGSPANPSPTPVITIQTPTPSETATPVPSATPIVVTSPTPTPRPSATPVVISTPIPSPTPTGPLPSLAIMLGIKTSIDLREFDSPVEDQFGGTCSDFATAAAMDNVLKQKGISDTVSEEDLWTLYGVYDADAAVLAASQHQVHETDYWPTNGNHSNQPNQFDSFEITQSKFLNYDMNAALKGLDQNHPVVMAVQVPEGLSNCDTMIDPNSKKTTGEHVMAAVGYKLDDQVSGGGYFILKNSWGPDCGEKGYIYYPFALCKRKDLYCYFIEIDDVKETEVTP